jgi:hypothetical protein
MFDHFLWGFPIAICMPPCQNLGFCMAPGVCNCPDNFEGPECQFAKTKPCLDKPPTPMNSRVVCNEKECISTCNRGFAFPGGSKKLTMICDSGNWIQRNQQPGTFQKVPDCQRNNLDYNFKSFYCSTNYATLCVLILCDFSQPYVIHRAQTEEDVYRITFVSVPKSFEDRKAIIVGPFNFKLKSNAALSLIERRP